MATYTPNQISWVINPRNLSFDRIRSDLIAYVKSRPDYERWKDFLESSSGTVLIELIAGLGTYNSFHATHARREAYLPQVWLYTSAINIAAMLGYVVNRVDAPRIDLTFNSDIAVSWDRMSPIAYYNDTPISIYSTTSFVYGSNTVSCFMGEWRQYTTVATETKNYARILLPGVNIDNNTLGDLPATMELYINGTDVTNANATSARVNIVTAADDLDSESVMVVTHQDGIILCFGDGFFGRVLRKNDSILLNYVVAADPLNLYTLGASNISINYMEATMVDAFLVSPGYAPDPIYKISRVAPGYFASKKRMVTGKDHTSILLSYPGVMSAGYMKKEEVCCTALLCPLFYDEHKIIRDVYVTPLDGTPYTQYSEEQRILSYLYQFKMVGEKIELIDPECVELDMRMIVVVEEGFNTSDLRDYVISSINSITMQLGKTFHIGEVTNLVSRYPGIYRVYLERPVSDKELFFNEYLKLTNLDLVVTSNKDYVVHIDPTNNGYFYTEVTSG